MGLTPRQAAVELLAAAQAALGLDVPDVVGLFPETPALDCAMLAVSGFQLALDEVPSETPGPRMTRFLMAVTWVDCLALGAQPDPAAASVDAARLLDVGWRLWRGVTSHRFAGCRVRTAGPAVPVFAEGGIAGWRVPVEVEVDG